MGVLTCLFFKLAGGKTLKVTSVLNSPSWCQKTQNPWEKQAGKEGENKEEIIEGDLGPIINKEEEEIHNATYNRILNNCP